MFRSLTGAIAAALVASVASASAADDVVSITFPDMERTRERLAAGVYGTIWQHPSLAMVLQRLDELEDPEQALVWSALQNVQRLGMTAAADDEGSTQRAWMEADLGAAADPIWELLEEEGEPAGDGTLILQSASAEEVVVARREGSVITVRNRDNPTPAVSFDGESADFVMILPAAALEEFADAEQRAKWEDLIGAPPERATFHLTAIPGGFREEFRWTGGTTPGALPIDHDTLAVLPPEPLMLSAAGFDGALTARILERLFTTMEAELARTSDSPTIALEFAEWKREALELRDQAIPEIEAELGVDLGELELVDLLDDLTGTFWFALTPGAPFPAVTVSLPAGPDTDRVVAAILAKQGLPPVEQGRLIPVPTKLPVLVQLLRQGDRWYLSSDQAILRRLRSGEAGGFLEYAAGETWLGLHQQGSLQFLLDVPAIIALVEVYLPLVPVDPKQKQQVGELLRQVRSQVGLTTAVVAVEPDGGVMRAEGLVSFGSLFVGGLIGVGYAAFQQMDTIDRLDEPTTGADADQTESEKAEDTDAP